ncbi:MAG: hypothetical protein ACXVA9_04485, partial [Bdellovibrionales bacterium]
AHGGLDSFHPLRYYPQSATSYPLSGLQLIGPAITNVGVVACDGDLFVDGSVFLNQLQLKTLTGCRIHATGPIFVQQAISYVADPGQLQKPNLQLVSARLISMGVGNSQCEASTDPSGWYNASGVASPTAMRFTYMPDPASVWFKDVRTRNTNPGSTYEKTAASPLAEGQAMLAIAQAIPGLQDASCHGRNVGFDHLFLVAPQIHSRYKGNFHGVIVTEFPMFSLGAFSYQFDPVFQTVPVLPKIPASEILVLK